jgi:hypothetical protein
MKNIILFLGLIISSNFCYSQVKSLNDGSPLPSWIAMIDNPGSNYYETIEEFENYWEGKVEPLEEEAFINRENIDKEEIEKHEIYLKTLTVSQKLDYDYLKYQCKRFENWKKEVSPFVQEDGKILSADQLRIIWEKQQKESKK